MSPLPHRVTHHAGEDGIWIEHQHMLWSVEATEGRGAAAYPGIVRRASAASIENNVVTRGDPSRLSTTLGEDDTIALPPEIGCMGALARVEKRLFDLRSEPRTDGVTINPDGVFIHDQGSLRSLPAMG